MGSYSDMTFGQQSDFPPIDQEHWNTLFRQFTQGGDYVCPSQDNSAVPLEGQSQDVAGFPAVENHHLFSQEFWAGQEQSAQVQPSGMGVAQQVDNFTEGSETQPQYTGEIGAAEKDWSFLEGMGVDPAVVTEFLDNVQEQHSGVAGSQQLGGNFMRSEAQPQQLAGFSGTENDVGHGYINPALLQPQATTAAVPPAMSERKAGMQPVLASPSEATGDRHPFEQSNTQIAPPSWYFPAPIQQSAPIQQPLPPPSASASTPVKRGRGRPKNTPGTTKPELKARKQQLTRRLESEPQDKAQILAEMREIAELENRQTHVKRRDIVAMRAKREAVKKAKEEEEAATAAQAEHDNLSPSGRALFQLLQHELK